MHLSSGAGSLDVFEYNVLPLHAKDLWYIALVHAYAFLSYVGPMNLVIRVFTYKNTVASARESSEMETNISLEKIYRYIINTLYTVLCI